MLRISWIVAQFFRSVSVVGALREPTAVNKHAFVEGSVLEAPIFCNKWPTQRYQAACHFSQSYSHAYVIQYTRM